METAGLECAVWPHLYWSTEMTETWARSQDVRRQARARQTRQQEGKPATTSVPAVRGDVSEDEESPMDVEGARPQQAPAEAWTQEVDEESKEEEGRRTSAKASFVAKVFSPMAAYGACYELQHFVYDLWLGSALGGARNGSGISLRGAVAGKVFSPMYWQTQYAGLVDSALRLLGPLLQLVLAAAGPNRGARAICGRERSADRLPAPLHHHRALESRCPLPRLDERRA